MTVCALCVCLAWAGILPPAAAQEQEIFPGEKGAAVMASQSPLPSPEELVDRLETNFNEYLALVSSVFAAPGELPYDFPGLKVAFLELMGDSLEEGLTQSGASDRLSRCLGDLAGNGVLIASLARMAHRHRSRPYVQEFIRSFCHAATASVYARGKIPMLQAELRESSGDLVVEKNRIWLASDKGFIGNHNGHVDQGEWAALKFGMSNRSRTASFLSSSARLVLLDAKKKPCRSLSETDPAGVALAPECTNAVVLTDKLPLPELSPGEQTTIGPFVVALNPTRLVPEILEFRLLVEVSDGRPSHTDFSMSLSGDPVVELAQLVIDDDTTGNSSGNGNHRIEPGEKIEMRTTIGLKGRKVLTKVAVKAAQYSEFLQLAGRNLGLEKLVESKPEPLAGDFEFSVPTVEQMALVPAERLDERFFTERRSILWLSLSACAGKVVVPADWTASIPDSYLCPFSSPAYRFVVPVEIHIEFGQLFLITSQPGGAEVEINGVPVGNTATDGTPLIYTNVKPVKNTIVYYTMTARKNGYEPYEEKIPVIFKDRTARNLTSRFALSLKSKKMVVKELPDPALTARKSRPKRKVKKEPVVSESKPVDPPRPFSRLALFLGPAVRFVRPPMEGTWDPYGTDTAKPTWTLAGFSAGASFYFTRNFFLQASGSTYFTTTGSRPALEFWANPASVDRSGTDRGASTQATATLKSAGFYSLFLQPGFTLQLWRLVVSVGFGLQLEGSYGVAREDTSGDKSTAQLEDFSIAARVEDRIAFDTGIPLFPFVGSFVQLPADGVDWGVVAGAELRLF